MSNICKRQTESRYSNKEREVLAACWSLEKSIHYVFCEKGIIETDHKPLESIRKRAITSASPRLQRLLLKMGKYGVEIRYIQGKTNVTADTISRVSYKEPPLKEDELPLLLKSTQLQALYQQVLPNWKKYDRSLIKTFPTLKVLCAMLGQKTRTNALKT